MYKYSYWHSVLLDRCIHPILTRVQSQTFLMNRVDLIVLGNRPIFRVRVSNGVSVTCYDEYEYNTRYEREKRFITEMFNSIAHDIGPGYTIDVTGQLLYSERFLAIEFIRRSTRLYYHGSNKYVDGIADTGDLFEGLHIGTRSALESHLARYTPGLKLLFLSARQSMIIVT